MTNLIKGVLITPNQEGTLPREYTLKEESIKDFHNLLDCDTFDIQSRKFGDEWLDVYCDDEGLLKADNKPAIVTFMDGEISEIIVGSVFICNCNEKGETISLTDEQVKKVLASVRKMYSRKKNEVLTVATASF